MLILGKEKHLPKQISSFRAARRDRIAQGRPGPSHARDRLDAGGEKSFDRAARLGPSPAPFFGAKRLRDAAPSGALLLSIPKNEAQ